MSSSWPINYERGVTGQILFSTHTVGFLSLQLYSGGEQPTPQEEVFTASLSRVGKLHTQVYRTGLFMLSN